MIFLLRVQACSNLFDRITLIARHGPDVEILLLRQQLRIVQRKEVSMSRISRWEKVTLVVLARKLPTTNSTRARLSQVDFGFETRDAAHMARRAWAAQMDLQYGGAARSANDWPPVVPTCISRPGHQGTRRRYTSATERLAYPDAAGVCQ
jgi:hypothetical protein